MEHADRFEFVERFNAGGNEEDLKSDGSEKDEIVSCETEERDVIGKKEDNEKRPGEDAGAGFFEAEDEKFVQGFFEPLKHTWLADLDILMEKERFVWQEHSMGRLSLCLGCAKLHHMTPTEIKGALGMVGGTANKRLGQHFLIDRSALEAIVEAAGIQPGERVLEVGPGLGVLTQALLDAGAEVVAIERDRRFAEYLRQKFVGRPFTLVEGDAADLEWGKVVGDGSWKFVSNLPYAITSLALRKALWSANPPLNLVVLVQREVAERAIARDGKSSLLSLMVALGSSSKQIVKRVPPGAFFPPPKVESAVLQIVPMSVMDRQSKWEMDGEEVMKIAKAGFAHPRKLLASNIKTIGLSVESLKTIGVNEKARAEELAPESWVALAKLKM